MEERTALAEAILKHWKEQWPRMAGELRKRGELDRALAEAESRTADLIHDLVVVRRMDYHAAWEMAIEEWSMPAEAERSRTEQSRRRSSRRSRRPKPRRPLSTSG